MAPYAVWYLTSTRNLSAEIGSCNSELRVKPIADDLLIFGERETEEQAVQDHDRKLLKFLDRCRASGIILNKDKFKLRIKECPMLATC